MLALLSYAISFSCEEAHENLHKCLKDSSFASTYCDNDNPLEKEEKVSVNKCICLTDELI